MKIIHCADIHLDSKMDTHISKEQAKERKAELLHTFSRMVDYAELNGIGTILIAGDLFDTKNVSATARNHVRAVIIGHPQIRFFYLQGNHDEGSFVSGLGEVPDNLYLFDGAWKSYVLDEDGMVILTGLELNKENAGALGNTLTLDMEKTNLVMLHGQEAEYEGKDKAEMIPLAGLKNKGIDYLALGHIHFYKEEALDARGVYCYPGCLEGRGFDECGEHGFVVLEIDDSTKRIAGREFVPIASRRLYTITVDISDCLTTAEILQAMEERTKELDYSADSLIQYELVGNVDAAAEKNTELLQKQMENRFYFVRVKDLSKYRVDYSMFELDKSLKGEFIRHVKAQADLSEEEKAAVIHYGIQALTGEEIIEI